MGPPFAGEAPANRSRSPWSPPTPIPATTWCATTAAPSSSIWRKALYGSPAVDLAHCTLYTSTTWDVDSGVEIAPADVADFYRHYLGAIPAALAQLLQPWLMPCAA